MTAVHGEHVQTGRATDETSDVEVVITPFAGFGRLAHLRRELLAVPGVRAARIAGYGCGEARFLVDLQPDTSLSRLELPGTRITHISNSVVALAVVPARTAS